MFRLVGKITVKCRRCIWMDLLYRLKCLEDVPMIEQHVVTIYIILVNFDVIWLGL